MGEKLHNFFLQNDDSYSSPGSTLAPPSDDGDDGLDSSGVDNNGKSSAPPPTQINKLKYTGPSHIRKVCWLMVGGRVQSGAAHHSQGFEDKNLNSSPGPLGQQVATVAAN